MLNQSTGQILTHLKGFRVISQGLDYCNIPHGGERGEREVSVIIINIFLLSLFQAEATSSEKF